MEQRWQKKNQKFVDFHEFLTKLFIFHAHYLKPMRLELYQKMGHLKSTLNRILKNLSPSMSYLSRERGKNNFKGEFRIAGLNELINSKI
jgi:hypothetical protein